MNAIPSVLGGGPCGVHGSYRYKDVAYASGLTNGGSSAWPLRVGRSRRTSPFGGERPAMMAGRGALNARPAQGRVGGHLRHIARLHETHPLLSAKASVRTDPPCPSHGRCGDRGVRPGGGPLPTNTNSPRSSRFMVTVWRGGTTFTAHEGEQAWPASGGVPSPGTEPSRGKGVRSA